MYVVPLKDVAHKAEVDRTGARSPPRHAVYSPCYLTMVLPLQYNVIPQVQLQLPPVCLTISVSDLYGVLGGRATVDGEVVYMWYVYKRGTSLRGKVVVGREDEEVAQVGRGLW